MEHAEKSERDRKIEQAYEQTLAGNYTEADLMFRLILDDGKAIPSKLVYYFGKNSYFLKNYYQSLDWLNKYIELKGNEGIHFEEAKQLIALNKAELEKTRKDEVDRTREILSKSFTIDCGPTGLVKCPVCDGETVIIQNTYFGQSYKTCSYCNKNGNMTCEDYNKLLRGEL